MKDFACVSYDKEQIIVFHRIYFRFFVNKSFFSFSPDFVLFILFFIFSISRVIILPLIFNLYILLKHQDYNFFTDDKPDFHIMN